MNLWLSTFSFFASVALYAFLSNIVTMTMVVASILYVVLAKIEEN